MDMYQYEKVMTFVDEEDVKFIRLAFFDAFGVQKNISIMSGQLERAFKEGISFDASAVAGFGGEVKSDLFLHPDPSTFSILPWRPSTGRVARMYCDIRYPDGTLYEKDSRYILKKAVEKAKEKGLKIDFGTEVEFYLFQTDENGNATKIPFDRAGYMDVAPEDKGENIRREIGKMGERTDRSYLHAARHLWRNPTAVSERFRDALDELRKNMEDRYR